MGQFANQAVGAQQAQFSSDGSGAAAGRLFVSRFADVEQGLEVAEHTLATTRMALDSLPSALPNEPDEAAAEDWLRRVRRAHYDMQEAA